MAIRRGTRMRQKWGEPETVASASCGKSKVKCTCLQCVFRLEIEPFLESQQVCTCSRWSREQQKQVLGGAWIRGPYNEPCVKIGDLERQGSSVIELLVGYGRVWSLVGGVLMEGRGEASSAASSGRTKSKGCGEVSRPEVRRQVEVMCANRWVWMRACVCKMSLANFR